MSATMPSMLAAMDCILERKPLGDLDSAIADTDGLMKVYRQANRVATFIRRPELTDDIRAALIDGDTAWVGDLVCRYTEEA